MKRPGRIALAALCVAAIVCFELRAVAAPRVALITASTPEVRAESAPTAAVTADSQLRAELEAAGFEVVAVSTQEVSPEVLERVARETDSIAAILVVPHTAELAADVWVTDRVTGKTLLRRVRPAAPPDEAARVLALRAVELLHASLVELNLEHASRGEEPAPPEVKAWVRPPPAPPPPVTAVPTPRERPATERAVTRFALAVGGAGLGGPGGLSIGFAPTLELAWRAVPSWLAELVIVAPATTTVSNADGRADVDQELAMARVRFDPISRRKLFGPYVAGGAGVYRAGVRGQAAPPLRGQNDHAISGLVALAAGLGVRASSAIGFVLEIDGAVATSRTEIRFAGQTVARTPQPLVLAALAAEVSF